MRNIIPISEIDEDTLSKLPVSLQLKNEIDFNVVPPEIKNLLVKFTKVEENIEQDYSNSLDFSSEFSIYNDFKEISHIKDLVILYIENYMQTSRGAYPFYPDFGTDIKRYVNAKDVQANNVLINEEFGILIQMLRQQFETKIDIEAKDIKKVSDNSGSTKFSFYLELSVKDEKFDFKVVA